MDSVSVTDHSFLYKPKEVPAISVFTFPHMGRTVDIKVSLLPSAWGPVIVNRILDKMATLITLEDLGYGPAEYGSIDRLARSPNGLILVTGTTGSGKTTTLYALLSKIASPERKTITIEDPVEYTMPCVTQCQVRDDREFSFSRALRSLLRHDPDIIMVGEIRDRETARIAIEASLTGHLVLSTLHTISALGTIVRLMDMDISTDDIASTLRAAIAQRLVRKLRWPHITLEATQRWERLLLLIGLLLRDQYHRGKDCQSSQDAINRRFN